MNSAWPQTPVSAVCDRVSVGIVIEPSKYYTDKGGVRAFRSQNVRENRVNDSNWVYLTEEGDRKNAKSKLRENDVLIVRTGAPGVACVVPKEYAGTNCIDLVFARPRQDLVDSRYLCSFFNSSYGRSQALGMQNGLAQKHLNVGAVSKMLIPLPDLRMQRKLADIFGSWDDTLEMLEALIAAKERRKLGLMRQLLTGKRRLPGFSKPWEKHCFGELMRTEDRYVTFDDDQLYQLVSARRRAEGVFFREALHGRDIKTKVMKQVRAGDFIISRMQVVHGGLGVVPPECDGYYASDSYEVLVPRDATALSTRFIGHLCRTRRFWHHALVCSHGVHIEKMTFVMADFEHEKFLIPEFREQNAIADVLDATDSELRLLRKQRTEFDQEKRGLMQQLLTGKRRVKVA